ncbi:MAG: nucleoside monophosphate kinase [Candidatus Gracilibacteria bacterium]|nr:nucleoside monophosphate kinase [Candidatus Gracilibacteria bacterium]
MNYVFIGIQGISAKGNPRARASQVRRKLSDFKLFESGTALRTIAKENSELGKLVKESIEQGNHISPSIVEDIMMDIIDNKSSGKDVIFDGFVRNKGNKISADKVLGEYIVVLFELSEEKSKERLIGRMYNPKTSETFIALNNYGSRNLR